MMLTINLDLIQCFINKVNILHNSKFWNTLSCVNNFLIQRYLTLFVTNENINCRGFGITIKPEKNNEVVK